MNEAPAEAPTTRAAARLLADIGVLLELSGASGFRARAFTNAARALDGVDADLLALAQEGKLTTLRGIGDGIAAVLSEFVLTGRSGLYEELRTATPIGMFDLLRVPGLGPKRIHTLYRELEVATLDALEEAATSGRIAALPGFGPKTERKILEGIPFARASGRLRRYPDALEVAARIVDQVREWPGVVDAQIVGALRRRMEVVDRIDLLTAANDIEPVLVAFRAIGMGGGRSVADAAAAEPAAAGQPGAAQRADSASIRLVDGMAVHLRCVRPEDLVVASVLETGSSAHVAALEEIAIAAGGSFGRDSFLLGGERITASWEAEVYERLGLAYVPPELREGLDEITRAKDRRVPRLLELDDLTGTFHCHTRYSDGKATLEEMAEAARARGWAYLGIADHSRAAAYAGGLTIEEVERQHAEIDALNERFSAGPEPFRLLKGIESDILPDGALDYPDGVLATFDYIVGSVHSSFGMPRKEMTERVIRAVQHPRLTILGHMTGRLLLTRAGYEIDVDAVLEAAAAAGTVVEINANPHRLDLDWRSVRRAAELGVLIAINPDAHSVAALDHVAYGVNMARKAGLEARQVLNAWPPDEVFEILGKRK